METEAHSPPSNAGLELETCRRAEPLGVYVHFPWCLQKCPYCDFLSIASERAAIPHEKYADAVLSELCRRARELPPHRLKSVFFGGGTPSLWAVRELGRVLGGIFAAFGARAEEVEVTVECNPTSLDEAKARALREVGVNRLSVGVQGLSAERLRFLGRLHDPEGGLAALAAALRSGMPRVSADLIFGVAGQTPHQARDEAARLADLGPTHLSAYALTIEPGTQFGALARKGKLPLLGEDSVAECFLAVREALQQRGFDHYEISNYAREGHNAQHNLGYWRGHDYLGLGCGAWGTVREANRRVRYRNTSSPERYLAGDFARLDLTQAGPGLLISDREIIEPETALQERLLLGLRLAAGVNLAESAAELNLDPWTPARRRAVQKLTARGLLEQDGECLRIPPEHWLLADGIITELL